MEKENETKMDSALSTQVREPGFWREMWQQIRLVVYLLRDPEVPIYLKLLPFAAVLYVLFPFDLLTDFAPVIGQLDDVTALLVGSKVFIELAPPAVVARHMKKIREQDGFLAQEEASGEEDDLNDAIIIDAEHEVIDKNETDAE